MSSSIGKIIRDTSKSGIKSSYFLLGDDYFMQSFFINKISNSLDSSFIKKYYYLNEDNDINAFYNDITSLSLFNNKNLFIIKNFNRLSTDHQHVLMNYIKKNEIDNIIIFVLDDYIIKNSFAKTISKDSIIVDTRTPINKNKIKEWIRYYYKNDGITIENEILNYFVDNYSNDIATIINEVEKHFLFNNDKKINFSLDNEEYYSKHIKIWNFVDAIGCKDLNRSILFYKNLYINGVSLIPIIISLNNFYFELYNFNSQNKQQFSALNKILQSKLNLYEKHYKLDEIINIFLALRDMDIRIKTTSINEYILFCSMIVKICGGYYEKK
tara:strand:+ start:593 stop:1570 length:978 start_codon:yes stop_codon:yes gene_type:complete